MHHAEALEIMRAGNVFKHKAMKRSAVASMLVFVLGFQVMASFNLTAAQRSTKKQSTMTDDQRIAHVLSRLTYGARPGDFEKVKATGVAAFINQQLDPDSIDNSTAIAKLRRLPTLGMATPVIIEQYTPPKPVPSASPVVAKSPEPKVVLAAPSLEVLPDRAMQSDRMTASSEI